MGLNAKELLKELEIFDDKLYVKFDFGASPKYIDSWRGSYDLPSLFWDNKCNNIQNKKFKQMIKEIEGMEVEGYKGGDFTLDDTDIIWLSGFQGDSSMCTISKVSQESIYLILHTQYERY